MPDALIGHSDEMSIFVSLQSVTVRSVHRTRTQGGVSAVNCNVFTRDERGCEITMFERDDLNSAYAVLKKGAERFASFDTYQALEAKPKSVADGECFQCDFRSRCQRWGGPVSA